MAEERAPGTIQPSERLDASPQDGAPDSPPLGQRVFSLRNVFSILLTLAVLFLVYRELLGLDGAEVWTSLQGASFGLFALAFTLFYCSFPLRALRWKTLLANVGYHRADGYRIPSTLGLTRIMYTAWFANCVTIARLGDAYRGYLLKKASGVSFAVTLGTVLAERLVDLVVLALMMGVGVLVLFGTALPVEATQALAAGLILSAVGTIGLLGMRRYRWALERLLPKRLHEHYFRLERGISGSLSGRSLALVVGYSVGGWVLEGVALYAVAVAVGAPVSIWGAVVVALGASLLTVVPITPAGLGFAEAGMVVMLGWLGVDIPMATAVTLLFRLINYWSIVVFGFILYVSLRNGGRFTKERSRLHG